MTAELREALQEVQAGCDAAGVSQLQPPTAQQPDKVCDLCEA